MTFPLYRFYFPQLTIIQLVTVFYLYIHYDSSPRDDTMHNFSLPNAYPVHLNDSETFLPLPELIRRHVRLIQKNSLSISFHSFRIFTSTVYFP